MENQIKSIMSSVFEIPVSKIDDESSPDTIESWDSLKHINFVIALEEELDINFSDNEIIELINLKLIMLVVTDILSNKK
ncbi:MAG: hypothetical protein CMG74_04345 [Candidatus Marinimicrobia bacterium]|nr:hypothetical protein [Candidatus Neomarinimicrobiota bacterium]